MTNYFSKAIKFYFYLFLLFFYSKFNKFLRFFLTIISKSNFFRVIPSKFVTLEDLNEKNVLRKTRKSSYNLDFKPINVDRESDLKKIFSKENIVEENWILHVVDNRFSFLYRDFLIVGNQVIVHQEINEKKRLKSYIKSISYMNLPLRIPISNLIYLDEAVIIDTRWSRSKNYYHWIMDLITKIELIEYFNLNVSKIIMPKPSANYEWDSLKIFQKKFTFWFIEESVTYNIAKSFVFNTATMSGFATNKKIEFLRNSYLSKNKIQAFRKIYVSRGSAQSRRVINEIEFFEYLKPLGFEIVICDQLSFHEQIDLFSSAQVIISSHGAALTNLVFTNRGITVIEIFNPLTIDRKWFFEISAILNHKYLIFIAKNCSKSFDIYIDVFNFKLQFNSLLENN